MELTCWRTAAATEASVRHDRSYNESRRWSRIKVLRDPSTAAFPSLGMHLEPARHTRSSNHTKLRLSSLLVSNSNQGLSVQMYRQIQVICLRFPSARRSSPHKQSNDQIYGMPIQTAANYG